MSAFRASYRWLVVWLLFYGVALPYALPTFLDWLNQPSDQWLTYGVLGLLAVATGVALSLYQAGRALIRRFQPPSSTPPKLDSHERPTPRH
ncbi:hypothetical protein [Hymenobacter koreensis]